MAEVDSLDIKIAAAADNAAKSLDSLIEKLNKVKSALRFDNNASKSISDSMKNASAGFSSLKNIAPQVQGSVSKVIGSVNELGTKTASTSNVIKKNLSDGFKPLGEIAPTMEQAMKKAEKAAADSSKNIKVTLDDVRKKISESWVSTDFTGRTRDSLYRERVNLQKQLQNQMASKNASDIAGISSGKTYTKLLGDIATTEKRLQEVNDQIEAMSRPLSTVEQLDEVIARSLERLHGQTESVRESVEQVSESWGRDAYAVRDVVSEVAKFETTTEEAKNSMKGWKAPHLGDALKDDERIATTLSETLKNLKVTTPSAGLDKVNEAIKKTRDQYNQLIEKIKIAFEHNENYGNTAAFDRQQIKIQQLQNQYRDLILMQRQLAQAQPYEILSNALSKIGNVARSTTKAFLSLASGVAKYIKSALKAHSASKQLHDISKKLTKSLFRVSNMLKMMVIRMALRKVIEGVGIGFKGLALYSDEFNQSISMLISSLKQLGYSVAAMVGPLLNAFAPAINKMIQLVITAVNYVNQLFSALTGKGTWIRAKKQVDDFAKSVSGASKEAKMGLRAFDEINNLTTPSSGGGSGDSEINPGDMFETVDIDQSILDLSDMLKEAWEKADFTPIGLLIGNKLNDALKGIDWNQIRETASKLGKSLGTLITGFVQTPDLAKNIGTTIGQVINTITDFFYNFFKSTEWNDVKTFISTSISSAFETVDTNKIGQSIAEALNAAFKVLQGIGEGLFNAENGEKIADGVNGFFNTFDFAEAANTVDVWVQGIEKTLTDAAKKIKWEDVFNGIYTFFENIDIDTVKITVGVVSIAAVGKWVLSGGAIKSFSSGISTAIAGVGIGGLLFGDITAAATTGGFAALGSTIGLSVAAGVAAAFGGFNLGGKLAAALGIEEGKMTWKEQLQGIADAYVMGDAEAALSLWLSDIYDGMLELADAEEDAGKKLSEYFGADNVKEIGIAWQTGGLSLQAKLLAEAYVELEDAISDIDLAGWYSKNVEPLLNQENWEKLGEGMVSGLQAKWDEFVEWFSDTGFAKWWTDVTEKFSEKNWTFSGIKEGLSAAFNNAISAIKTIWNKFVDFINEALHIEWDAINVMGKEVVPAGNVQLAKLPKFQGYAQGGFPEDGWFRVSKGEYLGQFDDGTNYVANNRQVTDGIAIAVANANAEQNQLLYEQNELLRAILAKDNSISASRLFSAVQRSAYSYEKRTKSPAFK